jgi:hypothetical protein
LSGEAVEGADQAMADSEAGGVDEDKPGTHGVAPLPLSPEKAPRHTAAKPAAPIFVPAAAAVQMVPRLSVTQNALNAALMVAVAIPAILFGAAVSLGWGGPQGFPEAEAVAFGPAQPLSVAWWLAVGCHRWDKVWLWDAPHLPIKEELPTSEGGPLAS